MKVNQLQEVVALSNVSFILAFLYLYRILIYVFMGLFSFGDTLVRERKSKHRVLLNVHRHRSVRMLSSLFHPGEPLWDSGSSVAVCR